MTEQHKEYIFEATKVDLGYHVHSVNGELTRCNDCKHMEKVRDKETVYHCCKINFDEHGYWKETTPNGFCSWAEPWAKPNSSRIR